MKIYLKSLYFIIVIIILQLSFPGVLPEAHADATTGYIWGRAMMPDGATGIPGCEVTLLWRGDEPTAKTASDADGNFIFTNLPPNDDRWSYRLIVKYGTWGQSITQEFSVMADSATSVQIRIYPYIGGLSLSGNNLVLGADGSSRVNLTASLLDVNGTPVPDGVHVTFTQGSYYGNPGRFFAGNQNGTEITLPTKGGKIVLQYGDVPGDTLSRGVQINAACVESAASKSLNLTLDLINPDVIEGTVYDATGRPVPFAKVYLSRSDGSGRFAGYNSTETGDRTDGSGACNSSGHYRFAVMPAGDYRVNASESSFTNSSRVTVVRGTYHMDITLPMGRGSIKGWVRDSLGRSVPGATVSLLRAYDKELSRTASNETGADGGFSFNDIWYGKYDIQAVFANQTADLMLVLDENRTSVTLALLHEAPVVTPTPAPTPVPANATVTPAPHATVTATPAPPTPSPPPVTPSYLVSTYGVALAVMGLICVAILLITLRMRPR